MAHDEACQLYIKQEIDKGLEEGKTPYCIAKEMGDWIKKLFDVTIPMTTLKMRAERARQKLVTNVTTDLSINNDSENDINQVSWGGKREGAGRKFTNPIIIAARDIRSEIREEKRQETIQKIESIEAMEAKKIQGVYDVIVIDPPWPIQKMEMDERPLQTNLNYPTMKIEEICNISIPNAADCHVWLWTTQKYLPVAFKILTEFWDIRYVCTFVWHKNNGYQPFGLPKYNCEFAIYGRKGTPSFIDFKAFNTCFDGPQGKHSEKPDEFYDLVRRVTAGRRLDMFNRRNIDGFDRWGKEV